MVANPVFEIVESKKGTVKELANFARDCFLKAFAGDNSTSDMDAYINERFNEKQLLAEMNCSESAFFEVRSRSEIVAYLKLNWGAAQTELYSDTLEIERIYVSSNYQGTGLAQKLFEHALSFAKENKLQKIWLGVWEHNPRAIRFYEKCGFVKTGEHSFRLGSEVQTDHVMTLELS